MVVDVIHPSLASVPRSELEDVVAGRFLLRDLPKSSNKSYSAKRENIFKGKFSTPPDRLCAHVLIPKERWC